MINIFVKYVYVKTDIIEPVIKLKNKIKPNQKERDSPKKGINTILTKPIKPRGCFFIGWVVVGLIHKYVLSGSSL